MAQEQANSKLTVEELKRIISLSMSTTKVFRLNMPLESAVNLLTGAYMAIVESRGFPYEADEETTRHISELATALTLPRPRQGFMLCGTCGNGKTTLVRALQHAINLLHNTQGMNHCVSIPDGLRRIAATELAHMVKTNTDTTAIAETPLLAIEDMGEEAAEVSSYGNVTNPIAEIIEKRYDKQLFTAITTNLTPKMLSEKYGARVADRFREMLTVITFKNSSYRK